MINTFRRTIAITHSLRHTMQTSHSPQLVVVTMFAPRKRKPTDVRMRIDLIRFTTTFRTHMMMRYEYVIFTISWIIQTHLRSLTSKWTDIDVREDGRTDRKLLGISLAKNGKTKKININLLWQDIFFATLFAPSPPSG